MRILIVWGETLAKPGSGTAHLVGLGRGLLALGHAVTIIAPRYGTADVFSAGLPVRSVRLPGWRPLGFLLFQLLTVLALPCWLVRYRPRAVYVRTCAFQGAMALLCRLTRRPLVAEVDSVVDDEILMRGQPRLLAVLSRALDHINNRLVSGLVCVSEGLRQLSIRRGAKAHGAVAIPNGAPTDRIAPGDRAAARDAMGLPGEAVLIGFAGSLAPWQGLDFLLDAAQKLDGLPGLKLAILGSGPMETFLRQEISRRGMTERFILLPPGPGETVARFLQACDAAVIPIHDRRKLGYCSPLKFYEAVAAGLPVFVPAGLELEDTLADLGIPGLFDPADPASLAEAMRAFASRVETHRARRDEVHRLADLRYSWRNVAEKTVELFERLSRRRTP